MRWQAIGMNTAMAGLIAAGITMLPARGQTLDDQRARLSEARAESKAAERRATTLERAAVSARDAAKAASAREAAIAARIQGAEADIAASQARIAIVDRLLRSQQVSLAERQGAIARLIGALQSLTRRPTLLSIAQPGSTADVVHVRAVLGTITPVIQARTAGLRAALERTRNLRLESDLAVASLNASRARFETQRLALVRMEAENRMRSRTLGRDALVESDRAIGLGERARDIVDMMATMDAAAQVRANLEKLPGPLPRPSQSGEAELATRSIRHNDIQPYRLPVEGQVVRGFGDVSDAGVRSRGITLATAPGARAIAPAPGRILFAGPFRDFGRIVIVDHGGGWTSLLTGLESLSVAVGDRVVQGSAIGRARDGHDPQITIELRRRGQPVDFVPLLG